MLKLDQREIPEEGLPLEGEIDDDIFELAETGVSLAGPIRYKARAYVIDGELVVEGSFGADFELECARCLEKFVYSVELEHHNLTENSENPQEPDLTGALREDILLALPVHPHCDEGKVPRKCPAEGRFDAPTGSPETAGAEEESPNPWLALDQLGEQPKSESSD